MSWNKQRVYKCDICGNEKHARAYEPGRVPWLWKHSGRRRGITVCDECCAAIRWARMARERENAAKRAAEEARERACSDTVAQIVSAFKKYGDSMSGGDNEQKEG